MKEREGHGKREKITATDLQAKRLEEKRERRPCQRRSTRAAKGEKGNKTDSRKEKECKKK